MFKYLDLSTIQTHAHTSYIDITGHRIKEQQGVEKFNQNNCIQ